MDDVSEATKLTVLKYSEQLPTPAPAGSVAKVSQKSEVTVMSYKVITRHYDLILKFTSVSFCKFSVAKSSAFAV